MNNKTATVSPTEIPVRFDSRPDVGRDFLTFDIPNGWDDVKKVCKKVLVYDGRKFTFSCWNSDRMECVFVAPHNGSQKTGYFSSK